MKPIAEILHNPRVTVRQRGPDGAAFKISAPGGVTLCCTASCGLGWDHLSVHAHDHGKQRTPTWAEMERAKRIVFEPDEVAMQLHVPEDDHINLHPHVLHVWRPQGADIPLPPAVFV